MAVGLQIDKPLGDTAQIVRDAAGTGSALAISTRGVGVGTSTPRAKAHVVGQAPADANTGQLMISDAGGNLMLVGRAAAYGFLQSHNREPLALNPLGNNVGIGTTDPQEALDVRGNLSTTGDIKLLGADAAEEFDVSADRALEPGDVMVLSDDGGLRLSREPYDPRVAGIVAGSGGHRPGLVLGHDRSKPERVAIALMGRVLCKADASEDTISVGDLLTTSSTPGHAQRATSRHRAFGAVIGKAITGLERGTGMVYVLVALQ